jgi:hypothetical protein
LTDFWPISKTFIGPTDGALPGAGSGNAVAIDRNDPVVVMTAKLVIEILRNGERDPEKIRQQDGSRQDPVGPLSLLARVLPKSEGLVLI